MYEYITNINVLLDPKLWFILALIVLATMNTGLLAVIIVRQKG